MNSFITTEAFVATRKSIFAMMAPQLVIGYGVLGKLSFDEFSQLVKEIVATTDIQSFRRSSATSQIDAICGKHDLLADRGALRSLPLFRAVPHVFVLDRPSRA